MYLKRLELNGFKSFAKKTSLAFDVPISAIVGPNGSGKSNIAEAFRWTLGEQSIKSLRGKKGEDLIFNGAGVSSRMNRASVTLVFDNSKKQFDIDFPEIAIERVVYRDGINEYSINGSKVRLRDIIELLSQVSLGTSNHHIISQNEADRILGASLKDRRLMIEDALGLRVYHWKIGESEKKFSKTAENIKEAQSLRREIGGHVRFLQKEAEKIEKVNVLKDELFNLYKDFFKKEGEYIISNKKNLEKEQEEVKKNLEIVENEIKKIDLARADIVNEEERGSEEGAIEKSLSELRSKKDELGRLIGRLEGIIELKEQETASTTQSAGKQEPVLPVITVGSFVDELEQIIDDAKTSETLDEAVSFLEEIRFALMSFKEENLHDEEYEEENITAVNEGLEKLIQEKETIEKDIEKLNISEKELENRIKLFKSESTEERIKMAEREHKYFEVKEKHVDLVASLRSLQNLHATITYREDETVHELCEAEKIFGIEKKKELEDIFKKNEVEQAHSSDDNVVYKKNIERLKIRIEESGPLGEAVLGEYEEIKKRDEFLEKEINDLTESQASLKKLIVELEEKLEAEFKRGVEKINVEFQKFFELMFGGGKAGLYVARVGRLRSEEELKEFGGNEEEFEEGIDISVNLPRKKIKSLEMLSGGERALTSIALLFAMSQVNPPPFLVLDETDAALDEANSRKYGDMLCNLSQHTQLIIITHNRETMSRAEVLYGVTMGRDGISKLLSVRFDEAVKIAK